MSNPLRSPDPLDQFPPKRIIDEAETGVRHPSRFEARTSTIPATELARGDAARVYRNAALNVITGDVVAFDSKSYDTTGIWNGTTTFTIPTTGKVTGGWLIKAQIVWPGTGAGTNRQIEIRQNGSIITTKSGPATTTYQDISDIVYDPNRNDTFTITVTQDSGGSLALTVGSSKTFFSMIHLG